MKTFPSPLAFLSGSARPFPSRNAPLAKAALLALLALPAAARAATYTFNGAVDSNWATSGNWSGGGIAPTNNTYSARRINVSGGSLIYSAAQGATTYNNTTDRAFVVTTGSLVIAGGSFTSNNTNTTLTEDVVGATINNVATSLAITGGAYVSNALTLGFSASGATIDFNVQSGSATIGALKAQALTGTTTTVNLDGGVLSVASLVATGVGTKNFHFNGGVLRTTASVAFAGFNNASVKSGGAVIDTNGHDSTISQALVADAVSTGGGLIKNGAGTLTLGAANTFTGATRVNAGTLALGAAGSLAASSGVEIAAGAIFDTTAQSFTMGGAQTFTFGLDGSGAGSAGLFQAASLDIGSASVDFSVTGAALDDAAYILATYDSIGGTAFASVNNLPAGYALDYDYLGAHQIALVAIPEPSAVAGLAGAAGLLAGLARRRRRA